MKCPKCTAQMEIVEYDRVAVARCNGCRGLWFEMLAHEYLSRIDGSESIDIGSPEIGKRFNDVDRVDCPVCKTQMIRMVDRDQPHIWYESCSSCHGVFFDAGEFRDYKDRTVLDYFRGLFARERK
jgi:uncharacterized protein